MAWDDGEKNRQGAAPKCELTTGSPALYIHPAQIHKHQCLTQGREEASAVDQKYLSDLTSPETLMQVETKVGATSKQSKPSKQMRMLDLEKSIAGVRGLEASHPARNSSSCNAGQLHCNSQEHILELSGIKSSS